MFKTIFFDAAGTLFHLPKGVGYHYALVGTRLGLELDATALDRAFAMSWGQMPARPAIDGPREDDDKGWWRELVNQVVDQVAPAMHELDRDAFFEVAYSHFAEAGVWELYPEVREVLKTLQPHFTLAVISNFDGRLRMILEQFGIAKFFAGYSFPANWERTNPIRSSIDALCSLARQRLTKDCTSEMIPNAIGMAPPLPDFRSFNWIDSKIRYVICLHS